MNTTINKCRAGRFILTLLVLLLRGTASGTARGAEPATSQATVPATAPLPPLRIALTADTEGHLDACNSCPGPVGLGGLARRATAVEQLRAQGPLLLLDAGNAPYGSQSLTSRGAAVIAAYDAIGYDAANVSYRDFRFGKAETVKLFGSGKTAAISANLLDADTGQPLFRPYVVVPIAGQRVAVIGLTDAPAGLSVLPRLRHQLEGVKIDSPDAALARCLPRAAADADRVVLLFYGSPTALAQIDPQRLTRCSVILLGDTRPDALPTDSTAYAADAHGRALAVLTIADGHTAAKQMVLDSSVARDPKVDAALSQFRPAVVELPAPVTAAALPSSQPVAAPTPTGAARQPRGLAGVGLTAEQVNAAIDRGSTALWAYLQSHDLAKGARFGSDPSHVLAALALVHCDLQKRDPSFNAAVRAYLTGVDPYAIGTYQCGLLAQLVEAYDDPIFTDKLQSAARYLLEAQGPDGSWNYGVTMSPELLGAVGSGQPLRVIGGETDAPIPDEQRLQRLTPFDPKVTGDNSASQFALLGLASASRSHIAAASDTWHRALAVYQGRHCIDGGWAYNGPPETASYGSMTCAGICATAICRHELGQPSTAVDPMLDSGMGWLADHFAVDNNPGRSDWRMYYLYSLERVGRSLDTEFIGDHEWYPLGAKYLLSAQLPAGTWTGDSQEADPRIAGSFALLFLTRATPTLSPPPRHGGQGILKTAVATPPPARVYIILDASGSMLDTMNGRMKFDVARDAVASLVADLPDHSTVALRVYGHRKRAIEPGADQDTALELPMAELDRAAFAAKLKSLRPRGMTPLALSLDDAIKDLSDVSPQNPVTVVLLTDGGEDTYPRRNPVQSAAALGRVKGITFHIVGFDIHETDWGTQLHAMADASGGDYWPAADDAVLRQEVRSAVLGIPREFVVLGPAGAPIDHGQFGDRKSLPEGHYVLSATYADRPYQTPFNINTDATTGVLFDASHARGPSAAPPTPPAPPASSGAPDGRPSLVARFCTHCGHPLPPGAKFCPVCGTPVLGT